MSSWFGTVSFSLNNAFFVSLHNLDSVEGYKDDREEQHLRLTNLLARLFTFSLESNFIQSCFKCIHVQNLPWEGLMQHYLRNFQSVFLKFSLYFLFCLDPTVCSCLFTNCTELLCSAQRGKGSKKTLLQPFNMQKELVRNTETFYQGL